MIRATASKVADAERWSLLHIWGIDVSEFHLRRLKPGQIGARWKEGITPDVVRFVVEKCLCAACGSRIEAPLALCACNAGEEADGVWLVAAFPRQENENELKRLYAREKGRLGAVQRALAVKAAGGKITLKAKAGLFDAQEGLCFYCGESLISTDGQKRFHCDHFISLTSGGRNDLENAVLACARCNLLKNRADGHFFIRRARSLQLVEDSSRLASMRKALALWRKARGLRLFRLLAKD